MELDFIERIDECLFDCKEQRITPERPFKGSFSVRIPTELYQKAALLVMKDKISLNNFVAESIQERVFKETEIRIKGNISFIRFLISYIYPAH